MSKFVKVLLIVVVALAVAYGIWYWGLMIHKNNMIKSGKDTGVEIVGRQYHAVSNSETFYLYLPKKNPTLKDIQNISVYIIFNHTYLSAAAMEIFDDKDVAKKQSSIEQGSALNKQSMLEKANHLIVMFDTIDLTTIAGKNYQNLNNQKLD